MSIKGSIEIVRDGESTGVVGAQWEPETVPIVLEALYGITDMESVDPVAAPTGRVPDGQWTGRDAEGQDVIVMLWPDIPFDETLIGQAIASSLVQGGGR